MSAIFDRLTYVLAENQLDNASWKDPYSPNYDRQYAEDVLYHTIGPLTDNPRYTESWSGSATPPPGYQPGGPAPKWTQEEVSIAYAGDPGALYSTKYNPRSPKTGKYGAPLYRIAKKIAKQYGQDIMDIYQNGYTQLATMMQPGYDEGRSPFISWVTRTIKGAVEHGIGGSKAGIKALGGEATETVGGRSVATGMKGIDALKKVKTAKAARDIANQVKGKYQTTKSYDKDPGNPFGQFSSRFYEVANNYADALDSQEEDKIDAAMNRISQLQDDIERAQIPIRGASTGAGEAVSTTSRRHSATYKWTKTDDGMVWAKIQFKKMPNGKIKELVDPGVTTKELPPGDYEGQIKTLKLSKGVSSLDVEDPTTGKKQDLEAPGGGGSLYDATMDDDPSSRLSIVGMEESQMVYRALGVALNTDLDYYIEKSPKLQQIARDVIKARGAAIFTKQIDKSGEVKPQLEVGGKLTANEFRFLLRHLGPIAADYPGKGVMRTNLKTARDKPNWWKPWEDPEIEPIPSGGTWQSIWARTGSPSMGADEIQKEMNQEVAEFEKLGIATARSLKADPTKKSEYVDPRTGKVVNIAKKSEDALSKTAISTAKMKAVVKMTLIAKFLALEESVFPTDMPILEGMDSIDRRLIAAAASKIAVSLERSINEDRVKDEQTFSNRNQYDISAVVTMPNEKALNSMIKQCRGIEIIESQGREARVQFKSIDIPMINLAASVVCEENGFGKDSYLISIGKVIKGRYLGKIGCNVLKNACKL